MASKTTIPIKTDFTNVYKDTKYFIDAIIEEYGFYGAFIDAVRQGAAAFEIKNKILKKNIELTWVEAIEEGISALDMAIRNHSKAIEEREEVLPIELSRNITSRSLRHLAQHTDYISKIEGDMITPSKILNVFHDETMLTYENKFVNTLIQRLFMFVDRRYSVLRGSGAKESAVSMNFTSSFTLGNSKGKIDMNIEVAEDDGDSGASRLLARVERLNSICLQYLNSDFAKAMGQNYVRPPIMRTNAILKNKYLKQCLSLWEFIETYDNIGYTIEVEESARKPDEKYLGELYSLLALQFMTFKYNLQNDMEETLQIADTKSTQRPISPKLLLKVKDIEAEDYNVYDTEYRRVIPVSQLSSKHKLSKSELRVREAIEVALAADKALAGTRKALEKEKQKLQKLRDKKKAADKAGIR